MQESIVTINQINDKIVNDTQFQLTHYGLIGFIRIIMFDSLDQVFFGETFFHKVPKCFCRILCPFELADIT